MISASEKCLKKKFGFGFTLITLLNWTIMAKCLFISLGLRTHWLKSWKYKRGKRWFFRKTQNACKITHFFFFFFFFNLMSKKRSTLCVRYVFFFFIILYSSSNWCLKSNCRQLDITECTFWWMGGRIRDRGDVMVIQQEIFWNSGHLYP